MSNNVLFRGNLMSQLKEYEIDKNVIDLDKYIDVKTREILGEEFEEIIEFRSDIDFDVSFIVDNNWFDPDYNDHR